MSNGYTRQRNVQIQNGNIADANDIKAEFDTLASAFSGSNGHDHSGALGQGKKISLTTSVEGVLPAANIDPSLPRAGTDVGEFRTNEQNDARFVQQEIEVVAGDGLDGGGDLSESRTFSVDNTVVRTEREINTTDGITGGGDLTEDRTFSLTGQALSVHQLDQEGFFTRVDEDSVVARQLESGPGIIITNPDGVAGNPEINLPDITGNGGKSLIVSSDVTEIGWDFPKPAPGDMIVSARDLPLPAFIPPGRYLKADYPQVADLPVLQDWRFGSVASQSTTALAFGQDDVGVAISSASSLNYLRSTDAGQTWTAVPNTVFSSNRDVATDGAGVWVTVDTNGLIRRSSDNGLTWAQAHNAGSNLFSVATDGTGVWLAVSTSFAASRRSPDNGVTWNSITVPSGQGSRHVAAGENGVWMIAATDLLRSTNDGQTFSVVLDSVSLSTPRFSAIHYAGNGVWLATERVQSDVLLRSTDDGLTWRQVRVPGLDPNGANFAGATRATFSSDADGNVLLVSASGIFVSNDRGASWRRGYAPRANSIPNWFSSATTGGGVWFITSDEGIARVDQNGTIFEFSAPSEGPWYLSTGEE